MRHFELSRETVFLAVFVAWTIATLVVRLRKPVDSNWPVIYWIAILGVAVYWDRPTWDPRIILAGMIVSLFLRFEFLNRSFEMIFRAAELLVLGYVLWTGIQFLTG